MNPRNEGIRPSLLCPPGPLQLRPLGEDEAGWGVIGWIFGAGLDHMKHRKTGHEIFVYMEQVLHKNPLQ